MSYEINVCDWTLVETDDQSQYGVAVNNSVVFESSSLDDCRKVASILSDAYNRGLSDMMIAAQGNEQKLKSKRSPFCKELFVVTPEMQKEKP